MAPFLCIFCRWMAQLFLATWDSGIQPLPASFSTTFVFHCPCLSLLPVMALKEWSHGSFEYWRRRGMSHSLEELRAKMRGTGLLELLLHKSHKTEYTWCITGISWQSFLCLSKCRGSLTGSRNTYVWREIFHSAIALAEWRWDYPTASMPKFLVRI